MPGVWGDFMVPSFPASEDMFPGEWLEKNSCLHIWQSRLSCSAKSVNSLKRPGVANKARPLYQGTDRQGTASLLNCNKAFRPSCFLEASCTLGLESQNCEKPCKEEGKRGVKTTEKQKPPSLLSSSPHSPQLRK